jgi:dihydroorotate dehydrogenase
VIGLLDRLARSLLYTLDPERAHRLAIKMLKSLPLPHAPPDDGRLATRAFGLDFKNPIGIAAGFDKHGEVADVLLRLGFGFVEVGTVTLQPQAGNSPPRLFRLDADRAVINRLGFNSQGADAVFKRFAARASAGSLFAPAVRGRQGAGIVGINIGANKDSPDRIADYVGLIERFAPVASYIVVNVSSPNTPGLRNLQQAATLDDLLARALDARERAAQNAAPTPLLLKIAPDLSLDALDDVIGIARLRRIDGMIVGNTTIARPATLCTAAAKEAGGLSGRPLFALATRMLAETYVRVEGVFPLIGAGGIDSGKTALAKLRAGASLIQIYSGLVFRGLDLLAEVKHTLVGALERDRRNDLKECIGADAASLTVEPWPR